MKRRRTKALPSIEECPACGGRSAYAWEDVSPELIRGTTYERPSPAQRSLVAHIGAASAFEWTCGHCGTSWTPKDSPLTAEAYTHYPPEENPCGTRRKRNPGYSAQRDIHIDLGPHTHLNPPPRGESAIRGRKGTYFIHFWPLPGKWVMEFQPLKRGEGWRDYGVFERFSDAVAKAASEEKRLGNPLSPADEGALAARLDVAHERGYHETYPDPRCYWCTHPGVWKARRAKRWGNPVILSTSSTRRGRTTGESMVPTVREMRTGLPDERERYHFHYLKQRGNPPVPASIRRLEGGRGMIRVTGRVTAIHTTTGQWGGKFGAIYGLRDGSLWMPGPYTAAPTGYITRIDYEDAPKERDAGARSICGWKHDAEQRTRKFVKVKGGLLVRAGKKPLWGIC